MADFNQAIKWLREGKKVRRSTYGELIYGYLDGETLCFNNSNKHEFYIVDFEVTDWEIYCEEHEWIFEHEQGCGLNDYACKELKCNMGKCKNCGIENPEEKLKTLEELEGTTQFNDGPKVKTGAVDVISLRREAIKHIKYAQKRTVDETNRTIRWIKRFFNITDEDL